MKSVHTALKLRHKKHTGKLLAHKHTSYRVLFLLMLVPIVAMALVDQVVQASDLVVSAKIAAPMPSDAPTITSTSDNATLTSQDTVISGTCPVIVPAVIVAIYDNGTLIGSAQCSSSGTFSVPVTLSPGTHSLVATVVTVTNDVGASSQPITVTYVEQGAPAPTATVNSDGSLDSPSYASFAPPVRIISSDIYVTMNADGHATWHGRFADGAAPYTVRIDWGDGDNTTYNNVDQTQQEYSHDYTSIGTRKMIIKVTDSDGDTSTLYSVAITLSLQLRANAAGDDVGNNQQNIFPVLSIGNVPPTTPIISFIQNHIWQIYIATLSGLVFLWYLEHGHRMLRTSRVVANLRH